jgi:predicted nucleic acid-binding protein
VQNGDHAAPRVFFDSSCLIAGAFSRTGASFILLQLAALSLLEGRISPEVRAEAERNTLLKLPGALPALRVLLSEAVIEGPSATEVERAPLSGQAHLKDLPILASAVVQECDYLLTLNERDFWPPPDLIRVMRPGPFLASLRTLIGGLSPRA